MSVYECAWYALNHVKWMNSYDDALQWHWVHIFRSSPPLLPFGRLLLSIVWSLKWSKSNMWQLISIVFVKKYFSSRFCRTSERSRLFGNSMAIRNRSISSLQATVRYTRNKSEVFISAYAQLTHSFNFVIALPAYIVSATLNGSVSHVSIDSIKMNFQRQTLELFHRIHILQYCMAWSRCHSATRSEHHHHHQLHFHRYSMERVKNPIFTHFVALLTFPSSSRWWQSHETWLQFESVKTGLHRTVLLFRSIRWQCTAPHTQTHPQFETIALSQETKPGNRNGTQRLNAIEPESRNEM